MIIPIGTQSSLALKPKLTIGLIAANVLVALITIPLMIQTEHALFKVQRERFNTQIRLYLDEHPPDGASGGTLGSGINESLGEIEAARDPRDMQIALYQTFQLTGISPQELESYGNALAQRGEAEDAGLGPASSHLLAEWKELRAKEQEIVGGSVLNRFGLIPDKMNRVHTFFTHLFLHGGIWHLLGNMLFLWIVGCLLEDSWGRLPFLAFYIAGGVIAGLVHCYHDTSSSMPLVGASGAIAAAMGAFTIRHFWTKIKLFYFFLVLFKPYVGTFYVPAFVFLPFWFITQIALHYANGLMGGASNVAYAAHIGGFVFGLIAALAIRFTGFEERFLAPSVRKTQVKAGVLRDPRFDRACELLEHGNGESARALFNKLLDERPEDVDMIQDVALLYREKGLAADYAVLIEKALKLMILKGNMEEAAHLTIDLIRGSEVPVNAQYLMRVAKWLAEQESYGEAHDVYRAVIAANRAPNVLSKAYIALAKLLSDKMGNARDAGVVLEEARKLPLEPEWQDTIAQLEGILKDRENTLYASGASR